MSLSPNVLGVHDPLVFPYIFEARSSAQQHLELRRYKTNQPHHLGVARNSLNNIKAINRTEVYIMLFITCEIFPFDCFPHRLWLMIVGPVVRLRRPQKNREANREAELLRAEEEDEAEEDRDSVERDEMARQDRKKRRAVVKEKKMPKKLEEVERDNMCEAMRLMSEVHKSSIAAAMAETRSYGKRKEEWERNMMELEAAESAPQSVASKSRGSREHTSDSHWGTFALGSFSPDTSCGKEAVTSFGTAETAQSEPVGKEVRGSWAVLSSVEEPFGAGVDSHIGNGGSGIGSGSRDTCILGKSKKPSSLGGVKFALKGKARPGQKGRARPKVAGTMAKAADVADAEEEAVEAAKAAVDAGEVPDSGGKKASAPEDAMRAAPAGIIDAAGELAKGVFSGSSRPDGEGTISKAVVFTHAPGVGSAPAVQSASVTVTNPVSRVQLAVSKPLLADNGTVAGRNLERAICLRRDARLGRMSWKGGLCMIRAIIKDARGGQRLRDISLTHNPSGLKIKVLGTKITVASPPGMIFKDGFYAGRSDDLVNGLRHLRNNLQKLDIHLEQHARGGQESLMRVENLKEKRLALSQVGEIMDEQEFQFIPALGGAWLGVSHTPKLKADSSVWWEGSKTPFVSIQLLVRRARLSSVRVEEDAAYAEMAAAARAAEMAAAASAAEMAAAASAAEAAAEVVETIAGEGNKPSRSSVWGVEETRQATRLFESMLRAPTARMFSLLDD